ncbi:hypothetical protein D3C86_1664330 [compost metagenome]
MSWPAKTEMPLLLAVPMLLPAASRASILTEMTPAFRSLKLNSAPLLKAAVCTRGDARASPVMVTRSCLMSALVACAW